MDWKRQITFRLDKVLIAIGILIAIGVLLCLLYVRFIHSFLSIHEPVSAKIMVVEGWMPDFALEIARDTFRKDKYTMMLTTGGVFSEHRYLLDFDNAASASAASLIKMGMDKDSVRAVTMPRIEENKTYTSALYVHRYLDSLGVSDRSLNVVSIGPHARRTRLLYQKALGKDWKIGIINAVWGDLDGRYWYHSLEGFRTEIDQTLVWLYARFVFKEKWMKNE